jgi:predicted phosphodiesterase
MKIGYISDIHLDFYAANNPGKIERFAKSLIPEEVGKDYYDILVVAGDIGHYNTDNMVLLNYLKQFTKNLICTTGNHDYYIVSRNQRVYYRNSDHRVEEFENLCKKEGIALLNPGLLAVKVDNNIINILGFNGWYDGSYHGKDKFIVDRFWKTGLNDSRLISPTLDSTKFDDRHHKDMAAVRKILDNVTHVDLVFSHVCPSNNPEHVQKKYRSDDYTDFFCFNGSWILDKISPKYWIYGHSHGGLDFEIDNTKFLCNTLGYPHEPESARKIKEFIL